MFNNEYCQMIEMTQEFSRELSKIIDKCEDDGIFFSVRMGKGGYVSMTIQDSTEVHYISKISRNDLFEYESHKIEVK